MKEGEFVFGDLELFHSFIPCQCSCCEFISHRHVVMFIDPIRTSHSLETTRALTPSDPNRPDAATLNLDTPFIDPEDRPTQGLVMQSTEDNDNFNLAAGPLIWKLNIVLLLISCWVSASLTGWGTISGGIGEGGEHTAANPLVGRFNMAMMAVAQNLAVCLYLWTLLGPRFFPDRVWS